jgi:hypothetical protein
MSDGPDGQITMSRIPIRGGIGAFVLIVILVAAVLAELPQLRVPFLGGVALGLVFAVALILWRRRTMDTHKLPPGAHTMFMPEPTSTGAARGVTGEAARDGLTGDERRGRDRKERLVTRPGAHPRAVPAS